MQTKKNSKLEHVLHCQLFYSSSFIFHFIIPTSHGCDHVPSSLLFIISFILLWYSCVSISFISTIYILSKPRILNIYSDLILIFFPLLPTFLVLPCSHWLTLIHQMTLPLGEAYSGPYQTSMTEAKTVTRC